MGTLAQGLGLLNTLIDAFGQAVRRQEKEQERLIDRFRREIDAREREREPSRGYDRGR